jgi:hypothetical protein
MDIGRVLAGALHGGVQGWAAANLQANQRKREEYEEQRKLDLLTRRQELMDGLQVVGYTEQGLPVRRKDYDGVTPLYSGGLQREREQKQPEQAAVAKEFAALSDIYGEDQAKQFIAGKYAGKGSSSPAGAEAGSDIKLFTPAQEGTFLGRLDKLMEEGGYESYQDVLDNVPTARAQAKRLTPETAAELGIDLSMAPPVKLEGYPEANPGWTEFTSNYTETAAQVAEDLASGASEESIRKALIKAGWKQKDVPKIMSQAAQAPPKAPDQDQPPAAPVQGKAPSAPPSPGKPKIPAGMKPIDLIKSNPKYYQAFLMMDDSQKQQALAKAQEVINAQQ